MKKIINKISIKDQQVDDIDDVDFDEIDWSVFEDQDDELSGFIAAVEEGYRSENIPQFTQKKSFAPSTIVWNHGVCPRYWYLAFEGNTFFEYKTGKAITNMDSGTDRHKRIQKAFVDAGICIENERKTVFDDPPIFGYVDSFVSWKDTEYIVEIKTCNSDAFDRHKKTKTASSYHILQLLIYMKIYKRKKGVILYENKNTHDLLAIPINITQSHVDFVDYLFDWLKEVYSAWKDKTIPAVPFKNNDIKICQACPVQEACKSAPVGDVKIARRKDEKGQF